MAINRGTLARTVNGKTEYIFPKTDASLVAYNDDISVKEKLALLDNYVTPQMFGAVADGEKDDTDAIQDALDHGGVIYFPPGRYKTTRSLMAEKPGKIMMCNSYPCRWSKDKPSDASENWMGARIETYSTDGYGMIIGDGIEVDGLFIRTMPAIVERDSNYNLIVKQEGFGTADGNRKSEGLDRPKDRIGGIVLKFDGLRGNSTYPSRLRLSHIIVENASDRTCPEAMFDFFPTDSYFCILDDITIGGYRTRNFCKYGFRSHMNTLNGVAGIGFETSDVYNWANSIRINNLCIDTRARCSVSVHNGGRGADNWVFENMSIQSGGAIPAQDTPDAIGEYAGLAWAHDDIIDLVGMSRPVFIGSHIWDLHAVSVKGEIIKLTNVHHLACFGCNDPFNEVEMMLNNKCKEYNNLRIKNLTLNTEMLSNGAVRLTTSDGYVTREVDIPMLSPVTKSKVKGLGLNKLNIRDGIILQLETGDENAPSYSINPDKTAEVKNFDVGEDQCFIGNIIGFVGSDLDITTVLQRAVPTYDQYNCYKYDYIYESISNKKPTDWDTEYYRKYYTKSGNNYNLVSSKTWDESKTYYIKTESQDYILLDQKPDDWYENYESYYMKDDNEVFCIPVPPAKSFDYNSYYKKLEDNSGYELLKAQPDDWESRWIFYYRKVHNRKNNQDVYIPASYYTNQFENKSAANRKVWYGHVENYSNYRTLDDDNNIVRIEGENGLSTGTLVPADSANSYYTTLVSNLIEAEYGDYIRFSKKNINSGVHGYASAWEIFYYDKDKNCLDHEHWYYKYGGAAVQVSVPGTKYVRVTINRGTFTNIGSNGWGITDMQKLIQDECPMITINDPDNFNYEPYQGTRIETTLQPILKSPNGTEFSLSVDDDGNLSVTKIDSTHNT